MNNNYFPNNTLLKGKPASGFTIVEIVIVIVVLGVLAAFAIPRFISLNDRAEKAINDKVFSAFQSAVLLAHAQWTVSGMPNTMPISGNNISMTTDGWPGSVPVNTNTCISIWNSLLSSTHPTTTSFIIGSENYYTFGFSVYCFYFSLKSNSPWRYMLYRTDTGRTYIVNP